MHVRMCNTETIKSGSREEKGCNVYNNNYMSCLISRGKGGREGGGGGGWREGLGGEGEGWGKGEGEHNTWDRDVESV